MTKKTHKATKTEEAAAAEYTHSVWTGRAYDRPQTHAELAAESMAILKKSRLRRFIVGMDI